MRKAKYDLDEAQIKPYFEMDNVLQNGVFYAANQLYGISFKERKDIPVYHPDVRVFEVTDADGQPLALFYADFFKRDSKGTWLNHHYFKGMPGSYAPANVERPVPGVTGACIVMTR